MSWNLRSNNFKLYVLVAEECLCSNNHSKDDLIASDPKKRLAEQLKYI